VTALSGEFQTLKKSLHAFQDRIEAELEPDAQKVASIESGKLVLRQISQQALDNSGI